MKNGFKYYKELGIIDWFFGSLQKNEMIESYQAELELYGLRNERDNFIDSINEKEQYIIKTIQAEEKEEPIIIRYIVIPDFSGLTMEVSAVAKVSNNGSTYLFTDNKHFLDMYSDL